MKEHKQLIHEISVEVFHLLRDWREITVSQFEIATKRPYLTKDIKKAFKLLVKQEVAYFVDDDKCKIEANSYWVKPTRNDITFTKFKCQIDVLFEDDSRHSIVSTITATDISVAWVALEAQATELQNASLVKNTVYKVLPLDSVIV